MRMLSCLPLMLVVLFAAPVGAEMYRWVDEDGTVHFSDRVPEGKAERIELEPINAVAPIDGNEPHETGESTRSGSSARTAQVTMYSTSWCGYCRQAREYFRAEHIPFTEHDIEESVSARDAYERLGAGGVPLIKVGERTMNGFSVKSFERFYRR